MKTYITVTVTLKVTVSPTFKSTSKIARLWVSFISPDLMLTSLE